MANGEADKLSFKMPFWPYSSYFAIGFMFFIVVVMWFLPFTRVALYVCPILMGILFISYKLTASKRKMAAKVQEDLAQAQVQTDLEFL